MSRAVDEHTIEIITSNGAHAPLRMGVRSRRLRRRPEDLDSLGGELGVEGGAEFGVPVADEVSELSGPLPQLHEQISCLLRHPCPGRMGGGAENMHPAGGHLEDEQ